MTSKTSARGQLFIVAAPSGAGKTSLVKALIESTPSIEVAVSHTTRPKRPDEVDHVDYHFVSPEAFREMQNQDAFIESAQVFGNLYGTSRQAVESIATRGHNIILEIDWQGAQQIRQRLPDSTHIFILPPSLEALRARLQGRGQDDPHIIQTRMNEAINEISHYQEFEYLIINDDFSIALQDLGRIVDGKAADLLTCEQQKRFQDLIAALLV